MVCQQSHWLWTMKYSPISANLSDSYKKRHRYHVFIFIYTAIKGEVYFMKNSFFMSPEIRLLWAGINCTWMPVRVNKFWNRQKKTMIFNFPTILLTIQPYITYWEFNKLIKKIICHECYAIWYGLRFFLYHLIIMYNKNNIIIMIGNGLGIVVMSVHWRSLSGSWLDIYFVIESYLHILSKYVSHSLLYAFDAYKVEI